MSEKLEVAIAKIVTVVLILLLLLSLFHGGQANGATVEQENKIKIMVDLFTYYNPKLSSQQVNQIANLALQAGQQFQIDPLIIAAIIVRESSTRPWVISKGGDYGLMQVRWRVHQKRIKKDHPQVREAADLLNPEINVFVGTEIFAACYAKKTDLHSALLRYSAGNKTMANRVLTTLKNLRKQVSQQ